MSYILDALNKSEQERRSQKTPDLGSIHRAPPTRDANSKRGYIGIGLVLVSINIAGVLWWQLSSEPTLTPSVSNDPIATSQSVTGQVETPNQQAIPRAFTQGTQQGRSSAETVYQDNNNNQTSDIIRPSGTGSSFQQVIPVSQLPLNIQRALPELKISSHVYSTDPSFRMININGNMMNEGEYVAEDFLLDEITEEGAIIQHQSYRFRITF